MESDAGNIHLNMKFFTGNMSTRQADRYLELLLIQFNYITNYPTDKTAP